MIGALVVALLATAQPLSADDVVRRALAADPEIDAAAADVDEAAAERALALDLDDPEVRFALRHGEALYATYPPVDPGDPPRTMLDEASASLRWRPPSLSSLGPSWAAAARRLDVRAGRFEEARRAVAARARAAHAAVLARRREVALATRAVELAARARDDVARRLAAGLATRLDEQFAALDALEAAADHAEARQDLAAAEARLRAVAGLGPDAALELVEDGASPCARVSMDDDALLAAAEARSPRLAALRAAAAEVDAEAIGAWADLVPWVSLLEVTLRDERRPQPDALQAQIGFDIPVFKLSTAPFDALAARRRRVQAEERAAREALAIDVARAARAVRDDRELVRLLDEEGGAVVERSLDAVERALEAGEADVVQAAAVRARALKAERARSRARLRCDENALELQRLVGDDPLLADAPR